MEREKIDEISIHARDSLGSDGRHLYRYDGMPEQQTPGLLLHPDPHDNITGATGSSDVKRCYDRGRTHHFSPGTSTAPDRHQTHTKHFEIIGISSVGSGFKAKLPEHTGPEHVHAHGIESGA